MNKLARAIQNMILKNKIDLWRYKVMKVKTPPSRKKKGKKTGKPKTLCTNQKPVENF